MCFKLKEVTVHFENGSTSAYLVSQSDLDRFLKATLELHHDPGVNPHSGGTTDKVVKITSRTLQSKGRFWWSTPGLKANDDPKGAEILEWSKEEILWNK